MNKRKAFVTTSALLFLIIACSPFEHDLTEYLQYIEVSDAVLILLFIFFISSRLTPIFNTENLPKTLNIDCLSTILTQQSYYTKFKFWLSNLDNEFNAFFEKYNNKIDNDGRFRNIQGLDVKLEDQNTLIDPKHFFDSLLKYISFFDKIDDEKVLLFCTAYSKYLDNALKNNTQNIKNSSSNPKAIEQTTEDFIKTDITRERCVFSSEFIKKAQEDTKSKYIQGHVSLKNVMNTLFTDTPITANEEPETNLTNKHKKSNLFQIKNSKCAMAFTKLMHVLPGLIINKVKDYKGNLLSDMITNHKDALDGTIAFWRIDEGGEGQSNEETKVAAGTYKRLSNAEVSGEKETEFHFKFLPAEALKTIKCEVLRESNIKAPNDVLISGALEEKAPNDIIKLVLKD